MVEAYLCRRQIEEWRMVLGIFGAEETTHRIVFQLHTFWVLRPQGIQSGIQSGFHKDVGAEFRQPRNASAARC